MSESFLILCKQNYFHGITPSNDVNYTKEGYKKAVSIAKKYFQENRYEDFAGYFQEGQYLIQLWTAHLLIEYGSPSQELKIASLKIIKKYTDNPLAPDVAKEEKQWLNKNRDKYKEYL